ncbi:MAG: ABC transporter permease subunit [Lachnospiraceae bacterium]|nr:ABC transporter permease subunit [Lachnospiraceae bacterium]
MNNKTVIGLNLKSHVPAVVASGISFLCLFLPYVRLGSGSMTRLQMLGQVLPGSAGGAGGILLLLSAVLTAAACLAGAVSLFATKVWGMKLWQAFQAGATLGTGLLLFSTKTMLKTAGFEYAFLNRDLSIWYWLGLAASFVSLVLVMRVTKTNRGYIALVILGTIWLFPILWILLTAFRAEQGYYVGYFIPKGFTFGNFLSLFTNESVLPFGKWWVNTFIVASCSCLLNTLIVLGTSYVLSRTRFAGRKAFMNVLMIIGLFPGFMSLIAVYNILKGIGLNQSLMALVVVSAAGAAMGYHVSKGFFDTIPKAIDEAAIIDGASRLQIFLHITLPLSKSIIVYTVLGGFLGAWSDYIFPSMLFGDKQRSYTVAVGLYWLTDFKRIDTYYTQFAAGAVVVALPIVILFIWLQKFYVEGLSGSVKG